MLKTFFEHSPDESSCFFIARQMLDSLEKNYDIYKTLGIWKEYSSNSNPCLKF